MARVSTYNDDGSVSGGDKLLGTDAVTGINKNYTVTSIADYLNNAGAVNVLGQLAYKFNTSEQDSVANTFHLPGFGGDATSMADVTQLIFSGYPLGGYNAGAYLSSLVGKNILLSSFDNLAKWAIYRLMSVEETVPGSDFYQASLTYVEGTGLLHADEVYGVIAEGIQSPGSTWGNIAGNIADQSDLAAYITSVVPDVPYETAQDILDALNSLTGQYALSFTPTPLFKQGIDIGNPDVAEIGTYNLPKTALEGVIGVGTDKYGYFLFTDSNGDLNWKAFPLEFITGFDEGAQVDGGTF